MGELTRVRNCEGWQGANIEAEKLSIILWEEKTKHEVLTKKYLSAYLEIFNQ